MIRRDLISSLVTAVFLMGCGGGLQVDTDYDPQADFASMETYAWAQRTPAGDDDPRVYNAIVARRLKAGVDNALQAKGFREVSSDLAIGVDPLTDPLSLRRPRPSVWLPGRQSASGGGNTGRR